MAQQTVNIGVVANDGLGDGLRDGGDKINDNFTEVYNSNGWGYYKDSETSPATLAITTTPTKLLIDGAHANSETGYLPREIRGISDLWDTTNDNIIGINEGDSYDARIDLEITGKVSNPNVLIITLDIGGGVGITIPIVEEEVPIAKTPPFSGSAVFPFFSLTTFITNGGQIFIATDTGSVTVSARAIFIKRDFNGLT